MSFSRIALGACAGFLVAGLAAISARLAGDIVVDVEHGYDSAFVDRFHPRERAGDTYFRWSRDRSYVVLHNLRASGPVKVEVRLRVIRASGVPLPQLSFTANDVTVHRTVGRPGESIYGFDFPSTGSKLRLGIESETFEAGGGRFLGVQVLSVRISPPGGRARPVYLSLWLGLAAALLSLAARVAGLGPWSAAGSGVALGGVFCWLVSLRSLAYSGYALQVFLLAAATVVLVALGRGLLRWTTTLMDSERRVVLAVLMFSFVVKMGAIACPLWLSSDADFQANRLSEFMAGNWYPSSVTQHEPPFRIPYPVSLFAVTEPLVLLGMDRVAALESVIVLFDVIAGVALVLLSRRVLYDIRAGALAALVYHAVPVSFLALSAGNFTNVFAVSTLTLGFAAFVAADIRGRPAFAAAAGVFSLVSLAAHFGMLLEGGLLWPLWVGSLFLLVPPGPSAKKRSRVAVAIGVALAAAGIYYLGYASLVTEQWERALGRESESAGGGVGYGLALSLAFLREQVGWVALVAAAAGGATVLRTRWFSSAFHACLSVWIAATAAFFALDLLSPLEIRYWFQALPVVALLAGAYLSSAFSRGGMGRFAAGAAVLYLSLVGLKEAVESMLYRYH